MTNATPIRKGTVTILALLLATRVLAAPPTLYSDPSHQSPVRGDPDDLLLLAGDGFTATDVVVYASIADTTAPLIAPTAVPPSATADVGSVEIVSKENLPHSLTVKLPIVIDKDRSYALWVRNDRGEWSNGARINDARPLWLTPAVAYSTGTIDGLPRRLKVVGRNLQPAPGQVTRVRLTGPQVFTLTALDDGDPATAIERYAAVVELPPQLPTGRYVVSVARDGRSWVGLSQQALEVFADPKTPAEFPVGAAGRCAAGDGADDTPCVLAAIDAAVAAGGGIVVLGRGEWRLTNSATRGVTADGIVLPPGVNLRGVDAAATALVRGTNWEAPAFALQGRNTVRDITFREQRRYEAGARGTPMLQLGRNYRSVDPRSASEPRSIEDVTITANVFDKPYVAIGAGGLPIKRLVVARNEFGAYYTALNLGGDRFNMAYKFRVDDTVVVDNRFKPGSYLDTAIAQGTIASQMGAAYRVDFSNNVADGTATEYLNAPSDARGWRAAFFWHMNGNGEMLLVAQNTATCTGDKAGDGEAIAYDNNGNTFGLPSAQPVLAATRDTVTVAGPLRARANDRDVAVATYYIGHWVQIAAGKGVGQARRVAAYAVDPTTARVTFTVEPKWDVVPGADARADVGREFWQVYTVDNRIDHRQPLCQKSNRTKPKGGGITHWAQTADSVIEGNVQHDTDGISFEQSYSGANAECPACDSWSFSQYFLEVRGNTIDGEYDWDSDCSQSGIYASNSAAPAGSSPPIVSYGVAVAHNTISHADGLRGGAITVPLTWHEGPAPHNWNVVDNLLIHHNVIQNVAGAAPPQNCDVAQSGRVGINLFEAARVWRTVLYANTCNNVSTGLHDTGKDTVRVCTRGSNACECQR